MTKLLTRDEILQADDLPVETVEVKEWGGAVLVKGLSLGAMHKLMADARDEEGELDAEAMNLLAVVYGSVDEDEKPLFDADDVPALREKSSAAMLRVTRKFMDLSGIEAEEGTAAARKNF